MPKIVDVDAQAAEGAIIYRIGGRLWYAAEPVLDTFKGVLQAGPDPADLPKAGEQPGSEQTIRSLESMLPQLVLLLVAWDEEGGRVVEPEERPTPEFLTANLSVRRASGILREVLGEEGGAAAS